MASEQQRVLEAILNRTGGTTTGLAAEIAAWPASERAGLVDALLNYPVGRRWLRGELLPRLEPADAAELARRLLGYPDDLAMDQRDRSTSQLIEHLGLEDLVRQAPLLAGSNAAERFWQRLGREAPRQLIEVATVVMRDGSVIVRQTALHLMLIDPYSPIRLRGAERARLLGLGLADPDAELRGMVAELLADEQPGRLKAELARWVRDPGERVRTAAWDVAFQGDAEAAAELAVGLLTDDNEPLPARRSALLALGSVLPTRQVAPILALMVVHPEEVLAEDAANLLWAFHRTPLVADAAARSPHPRVREVAERLLHPELGSPAAGGSRPDAPDSSTDVYEQFRRSLEDDSP